MIKIIILAAGKGTRMKSDTPKVLHKLAEITLLEHVLIETQNIDANCEVCVVTNDSLQNNETFQQLKQKYNFQSIIQSQQKGTADAVLCALKEINLKKYDDVIVTCADTPLLSKDTFKQLIAKHHSDNAYATCVCFEADNPFGYGRVILNEFGKIEQIVEQKDLKPEHHDIDLCNSGVMMIQTKDLGEFLKQIEANHISGEFYLTDFYQIAYKNNKACVSLRAPQEELVGINTQEQRAQAEELMQLRVVRRLSSSGVYIIKPQTSYFAADFEAEPGITIYPNVYIGKGVKVGANTQIHSFCWLMECSIGPANSIGPFARIRPQTKTAKDVKIGNFVEVKKAEFSSGVKASHLAYIGDATIKENVNIGAGTIFCNYDGENKHHSVVEKDSFIGSNSCIISPIHVAEGSLIAAGSVITKDTEKNKIAITRPPQKSVRKGRGD